MRNSMLTSSLLSLALVVGLFGCQAAPEFGDDGTSAAQSDAKGALGQACAPKSTCRVGLICDETNTCQTARAAVLGDACHVTSECAGSLVCIINVCIPAVGLSVRPVCTANKAARITLMQRDPDAPWIGDGPPPSPSYSFIGKPIVTGYDTGDIASFPTAGPGTYIIVMEGQSGGTQQTSEFDYDGTPTLMRPAYNGFCYAETPQG